MPPPQDDSPSPAASDGSSGAATPAQADERVGRRRRPLFAFGFHDRGACKSDAAAIARRAHAHATQRIEETGSTLLENKGILPPRRARLKTIAMIDQQAARFEDG